MNRVEIKENAKQKIKGNIWNLIWPLLVIGVLQSIISRICGVDPTSSLVNVDLNNLDMNAISQSTNTSFSPASYVIELIFSIINVAYLKYVLNFIRTGKFEFNDIIDCIKTKWLNILIVSLITSIVIGLGFALLIVPGIILALGLSMASLIIIDTVLGPIDAIKKSWSMMKGYKWNYLVFTLSFLGWILLSPFTLFILLIWLVPYMEVAIILYYEKLKDANK